MDFVGGALPNVIFLAGLIALGTGLGIEFKIIEIKGELSKQGRLGAIAVCLVLMGVSVVLYTRPVQTAQTTPPAAQAVAAANVGASQQAGQQSAPLATAAPAAPTPQPEAVATAISVAAPDDALQSLRALFIRAIADGRIGKDGEDLLKKLAELQDKLDEGEQQKAAEQLRELQKKLGEGAREGKMDAAFVQEATALIDQLVTVAAS